MRTAIIGSRTATDAHYAELRYLALRLGVEEIVSGGAQGADQLAKKLSEEMKIPITEYHADWKRHGKAAGPLRNTTIIQDCEYVIALWDGVSKGTADSIKKAKARKIGLSVIWI